MSTQQEPSIEVRENLNFELTADIPRHWNGGNPFKTRFFDAMSLTFPLGERYFISTVRPFKDAIQSPQLKQEVKDFTRQEGQHGILHTQFNDLLKNQGLRKFLAFNDRFLDVKFKMQLKYWSKNFNLAYTAGAEHFTAILASTFFARESIAAPFDKRMLALWTWHAIEEMEHRAVAYDVLTKVAKANYFTRIFGLIYFSIEYPLGILLSTNFFLKQDGFSFFKRVGMMLRGMWWLFKPTRNGVFFPVIGYYFSYFKPGFHPGQHPVVAQYKTWSETFTKSKDPLLASQAFARAAYGAAD